jgi:hypothetical protein
MRAVTPLRSTGRVRTDAWHHGFGRIRQRQPITAEALLFGDGQVRIVDLNGVLFMIDWAGETSTAGDQQQDAEN